MFKLLKSFILIIVIIAFTEVTSVKLVTGDEACTFRGAIYEHVPIPYEEHMLDVMLKNVEVFATKAKEASQLGAQIIVFPEYGITGVDFPSEATLAPFFYQEVPDPNKVSRNPCEETATTNNTLILYHLSCIAKVNTMYVVANLPSIVLCDPVTDPKCPQSQVYHFNTDVAFGPNGTLISRYHKQNLYAEYDFDTPPQVEYAFFDTPFGRMGMITCFDLMWYEPMVPLVETYAVDTLIFPTAWMDQLPFLASVQAQQAFSLGLKVNMLAANIHKPPGGFVGSGIYSAEQGAIDYTYDPDMPGKLITADLPCKPSKLNGTRNVGKHKTRTVNSVHENTITAEWNTVWKRDLQFIKYQDVTGFHGIIMENLAGNASVCYNALCCHVEYQMEALTDVGVYMLLAYSGGVSEGNIYTLEAEICTVMWCPDASMAKCSRVPTDVTTRFESLYLMGNFTTSYLYPNIFASNVDLMPKSTWDFKTISPQQGETCLREPQVIVTENRTCAILNAPQKLPQPLLVASIYGRKYDQDCWPCNNAITAVNPSMITLQILLCILTVCHFDMLFK